MQIKSFQQSLEIKRGPIPKKIMVTDQEIIMGYLDENHMIDKKTAHIVLGYRPSNNVNNYPRRVIRELEGKGKLVLAQLGRKGKVWISTQSEHLIPLIFLKNEALPPEKFIQLLEKNTQINNIIYIGEPESKKITGYHYGTLKKLGLIKINTSK